MRNAFQVLRQRQFDVGIRPYRSARQTGRPARGWIHAVREAMGVTSGELARRLRTSRQLPLQLEKSEAEDRITLKSLRSVADALDCDLVYALVPRAASLEQAIAERARAEAEQRVRSVEHSMALEDQAVGGVESAVEDETRRLLRKRTR